MRSCAPALDRVVSPTSMSSSPVVRMLTRARGPASTCGRPTEASTPSSVGPSRTPGASTGSRPAHRRRRGERSGRARPRRPAPPRPRPRRWSCPRPPRRRRPPRASQRRSRSRRPPPARPSPRAGAPARERSTTRRRTPAPLSLARTAKPSIAEFANGGTSNVASIASASTRSRPSRSTMVSGGSGCARSSTSERASSNSVSFAPTVRANSRRRGARRPAHEGLPICWRLRGGAAGASSPGPARSGARGQLCRTRRSDLSLSSCGSFE